MSETQEIPIQENTSNPDIPEEIIKDMMFQLPVKSLLKFRSVSHSWLSFIDSPYFIKTHMSKSTPKIILNAPEASFVLHINTQNPKPQAEASGLKFCFSHKDNYILGSCNGVLLTHSKDRKYGVVEPFENRKDVVLQNPSTRTFHKVPFMKEVWNGPEKVVGGPEKFIFCVGYDALNDDYKVFRNCQYSGWCVRGGSPFYSHVTVYSMKKRSYKQIAPFPYYVQYPVDRSVFAGGALHWVVSSGPHNGSRRIASFDVMTEEYGLVEQPVYSSHKFLLYLRVLGGCLTIVCRSFLLDVWVMKEYGNVESWSKILSFGAADIGVESIRFLEPLLYSECGKKLLMINDFTTLLWYDLEKKSAEIVQLDFPNVPKPYQFLVHLESLVKLRGPGPWEEKRGAEYNDEKPKKVPKKRDDFMSKGFKLKL